MSSLVLFPNQEECLWEENYQHQSRQSWAPAHPLPWAEYHELCDLRDAVVQELRLPNQDVVPETWAAIESLNDRAGDDEQTIGDLVRERQDLRTALREAAMALERARDPVAAQAAREAAGPESLPETRGPIDPDAPPF